MRNHRSYLSFVFTLFAIFSLAAHGLVNTSPDSIENLKKINTVNLLMPLIYENLDSRTVQYMLRGYNGCYEWFSSQPGVLGVKGFDGLENRCHPQALVSLGTNTPYNNIIWITAKDKETGDILRCESRVAKVHRIEIMTKLRTIDVGDVEILEVLGYDKEGNVFSTLEGMRFEWSIQANETSNLELVSLKDSAIKTTALRKSLETSNFQTDIIVARGLKTGKALVSVRLKERDYGEVKTAVNLYVIEHFIIYPDYEIYVLPYAKVNFNLALIKSDGTNGRRLTPVSLPSANYRWTNEDTDKAKVTDDGVVQCLNRPGAVHIKVRDLQTVDNTVEGLINIVTPYSIDIQIMEYSESAWETDRIQDVFERNAKSQETKFENVWNLIKDKEYYVRLSLYDETMKQIRITPNAKFNFEIDRTVFQVVEERNHEYRIRPIKLVQNNRVSASLDSISSTQGVYKPPTAIRTSREYRILSKISIIKPSQFIHLPILGGEVKSTKSQQTFKLHALGGSGRYEWVTRDLNIATISREAVILPKSVGRTVIEVRDVLNNRNLDEIEVVISEISELAFLEEFKEVVSNDTGFVNVYAKGGNNNQHYSNCSFLSVSTLISNPNIAIQVDEDQSYEDYLGYLNGLYTTNTHYKKLIGNHFNQDENLRLAAYETHIKNGDAKEEEILRIFELYRNYGLCSRVAFQGEFKGETYIRATLGEVSQRRVTSHKELRLKVYDNFKTRDPVLSFRSDQAHEVILAYGSSFVWELEDGPTRWDDSRKLNIDLQPVHFTNDHKEVLEYKPIEGSKSKRSFLIQCKTILSPTQKPANFNLKLAAWNDADHKLPVPVRLETDIRVSCRHPSSIEIYIRRDEAQFLDVNSVQSAIGETFTIRHNEPYEFQTWVFDEFKRPFYNFSSVRIEWNLNPRTSGSIEKSKAIGKVHPLAEDQYARVILTSTDGEATLKATIESPANKPAIYDEVSITIKNDIHLEPSQYVLFNHPENSFDIQVTKGSGDFGISVNDTSIVKFEYNRATQVIKVVPLKPGYAEISVEDRRLVNSRKATCSIVVASPSKIQLATDRNVVEEGHSTVMTVTLFEAGNRPFRTQELRLMDISLSLDSDSEYLKNYAVKITPYGTEGNQFSVEGKLRGDHRFVASAELPAGVIGNVQRRIQSNPVEIHVFPKLATRPGKLVLSPGCFASLEIVGGPSERAKAANSIDLTYTLDNTHSIQLTQQDANVFVAEGIAKGTNKLTFYLKNRDNQLISTLEVPATIADVDKVEILGMVDRKIHVGSQARLIAVAKIGDEIFKPSLCPFRLQWNSKNENILKIQTPSATATAQGSSIVNKERRGDFNIAINATALTVGVAEIELRLSSQGGVERSTTVKIRVIEPLSVDVPTYVGLPNYAGAPTWDANSVCKPIPPAHPALLLLPPHTEYQISPNNADDRNLRYSISTPSSKVALSETGLLTTHGEKGRVTILVEDTEVDSELLMVNVLITNIYSILVENSYGVLTLPTDADSHLKIHLQDTLGRAFPSPNELGKLSLSLSISDHRILEGSLVEKNSILYLRAKSEGLALVTVYLTENPSIFDIFYVNVGSVITPTQSPVYVHQGGHINFLVASSPVGSNSGNRWSSEDSSIVDIHPSTGRATAKNAGKTHVHFSDTIEYASRVEVLQANKFVTDRPDLTVTNVQSSSVFAKEYEIPFRVFSDNHEIKLLSGEKDSVNNNLNFECSVTPAGWFIASPKIKEEYGRQTPYCILRPVLSAPHGATPSIITVRPTLRSSLDSHFSYSQAFTFPFLSTFRLIKPEGHNQVTLNKDVNQYSIQVHTTNRLDVSSPNLNSYIVSSNFNERSGVHTVNIEIPSGSKGPISGDIHLEDLQTGHKETVRVYYEQNAPVKREGASFNLVDYALLTIIIVVILSLVYSMKNKSSLPVENRQPYARPTPVGPVGQYYSGYNNNRGESYSTGRGFGFSETPNRSANQSNISDRGDPYLRTSYR